jgi:hypothetical protein
MDGLWSGSWASSACWPSFNFIPITQGNTNGEHTRPLIALISVNCYNPNVIAELCSGSTGDFGSSSPGSNPGSAATDFSVTESRVQPVPVRLPSVLQRQLPVLYPCPVPAPLALSPG